ncbi:MAG: alpha/beta hydrolase, partial [Spirulinaceae cyanobacterium RM2_2_10]|nr:alpha/beta hydrolase [Spirulinaceae cyanobacterium RM2_2_10]
MVAIAPDVQTVAINGVDHYCEWIRQPSAPPKPVMVFVHGWGGSARYWESTARAIADQFDCLLYDQRGFGRSAQLVENISDYALETYADELAALLDHFGLERVYLNGHSVGASIAVLFLQRQPQRVERAILTCSGIFDYNPFTFTAFHQVGALVVKLRFNWFLQIPFAGRLFMSRFVARPL